MSAKKTLARLARGNLKNVGFGEFCVLVEAFKFTLARVSGSHHIYTHPAVKELINIQEVGGEAKGYQIRQFLGIVERYNLSLDSIEADPENDSK